MKAHLASNVIYFMRCRLHCLACRVCFHFFSSQFAKTKIEKSCIWKMRTWWGLGFSIDFELVMQSSVHLSTFYSSCCVYSFVPVSFQTCWSQFSLEFQTIEINFFSLALDLAAQICCLCAHFFSQWLIQLAAVWSIWVCWSSLQLWSFFALNTRMVHLLSFATFLLLSAAMQ